MIDQLAYYDSINGKSRLLLSENASRVIDALVVPPYRLADAQGLWPVIGKSSGPERALDLVRLVTEVSLPGPSETLPALSKEEEAVAKIFLGILAYAGGRNINLGRAAMLVHMENCKR